MRRASYWIDSLGMQPHPEGGYYRETYRSAESVSGDALPERYGGERSLCTAIYFLLESGSFSALHRLKSDEIWFYHDGLPLLLQIIQPDGGLSSVRLGNDPEKGEQPQAVISAGCWFGGGPEGEGGYTLISCTVAPGFDFADFELADPTELKGIFPQYSDVISSLTR